MKRLVIVAVALLALTAPPVVASTPPAWNLTGTYTVEFTCTSGCETTYVHTMTIVASDDSTGAVTGTGYIPSDPDYTWTMTGTVSGSQVGLDIEWSDFGDMQGYNPLLLTGTIDSSGGMSGTASDHESRTFSWRTTAGAGTPLATHFVFTDYPVTPTTTDLGDIAVQLEDVNNDIVLDTRTVTLSISQNAPSFTCTDGLSKAAVDGVATFTGCTQTTAATGYTITAAAVGVPDLVGDPFDVTGPPEPTHGTIAFVKVIDNWADAQGTPPLEEFTLTYADVEAATSVPTGTAHSGDVVELAFGDYVVGEDVSRLPSDFVAPSENVQCTNAENTNEGDQDVAHLTVDAANWTCTIHNVYSVPIVRNVIVGGTAGLDEFSFGITQGADVTTAPGSEFVPSDGTTGTYYGGALVGSFTIAQTVTPARYLTSYEMDGLVSSTGCSWEATEPYETPPVCTITNTYVAPSPAPTIPLIALAATATPASLTASGTVAYTYTVTNPGSVPLAGVSVADPTCSPVAYGSGDSNADLVLQAGETWTYGCSATRAATITSVATATGTGGGLTASASASVTVTVGPSVPTPTIITDGIAPGVNRGTSGFGTRSLVVPANTYVTVMATTNPSLAGSLVEIWVESRTTGWHLLTLREVAADGTAHYFTRVNGWTAYWVKFAGDDTHQPGHSHGRIATNPS
jgi:uncharacterized repeat protein (TIGR01451 family)